MSETLQSLIQWMAGVPSAVLYAVLAAAACLENLVPPLPADSVIALGAFLAARGHGSPWGAWAATMVGNLAGALLMYRIGARVGIGWLMARVPGLGSRERADQLGARLTAQGIAAVAVSRLLPGVRALVPPVAGAIGLPFTGTAVAMGLASALWYGLICWVAFTAGTNADVLLARMAAQQRVIGIGAVVLLLAGVGRWWWSRRPPTERR